MNDNLIFSRNWEDTSMVELKVEAQNEYVHIWQTCYTQSEFLAEQASRIKHFMSEATLSLMIVFGQLEGNATPSFSMKLIKVDQSGHLQVELNMENEDDDQRRHRCQLYVATEVGQVLDFCQHLLAFSEHQTDRAELNKNNF